MLYIDNPVGTGFSYTDHDDGYPKTDEAVAEALLEALRQFMLFLPSMVSGIEPAGTPLFAFGQSYGGAYVVSLSHLYLSYRENNPSFIKDIWLKGIGIGNGFISPTDQSLYADYVSNLGYVSESQYKDMKEYDNELLESLKHSNYVRALEYSHKSLNYFVTKIMQYTNIYDFTFNQVNLIPNSFNT
jgi:vitellogenic carboxypeptidase-like protein